MADKKQFKCTGECGKEFSFGDWECFPGLKHTVAPKTYYKDDAPFCDFKRDPDGLSFRTSRTFVHVIPEKRLKDETGSIAIQAASPVCFIRGKYETTDPEQQFYIERAKIDVGKERWYEAYHTPIQKQRIKDNSLAEREVALAAKEAELNELLASVKKGKTAEATK